MLDYFSFTVGAVQVCFRTVYTYCFQSVICANRISFTVDSSLPLLIDPSTIIYNLVSYGRKIESHIPREVTFVIKIIGRKLPTSVLHFSSILKRSIQKTDVCIRHCQFQKDIGSQLVIPVESDGNASFPERSIKTNICNSGRFPFYFIISHYIICHTNHFLIAKIVIIFGCHRGSIRIVTYFLISQFTPTTTKLERSEWLYILHERFIGQDPCSRKRREIGISVRLWHTGRTVTTNIKLK